jgi:hypothetical protein
VLPQVLGAPKVDDPIGDIFSEFGGTKEKAAIAIHRQYMASLNQKIIDINAAFQVKRDKLTAEYEKKDADLKWQLSQTRNKMMRLYGPSSPGWDDLEADYNNKQAEITQNYQQYRSNFNKLEAERKEQIKAATDLVYKQEQQAIDAAKKIQKVLPW